MNDPLADLKDIHLPEPISWWPPAPGWWLLLALLAALILALAAFLHYRRKYQAWRKAALRELARLENTGLPAPELTEAVAALVRRSAMTAERVYRKPARAAHLQGAEWQAYLQAHMPAEAARWLAIDRYQACPDIQPEALLQATRYWIKRFKP